MTEHLFFFNISPTYSQQYSTSPMKNNFLSAGVSFFAILYFFSFFAENHSSVKRGIKLGETSSSNAFMLMVDAGQDLSLCEGHTAYLGAIATDGTSPYTYVWSNGLGGGRTQTVTVGTTNVTYTVTVTDNIGATATDQMTVISAGNSNPVINCPGNQTVASNSANCGANVALTDPTATDDCPPPTITSSGATGNLAFNYYGTYNGHYYYISNIPINPANLGVATQPEAVAQVNDAAIEFTGYLATIADATENQFATYASLSGTPVFVGYTDEQAECAPGWFGGCCGEPGTGYTNFLPGEPDDGGTSCDGGGLNSASNLENYTEITSSGEWNDFSLTASDRYALIELTSFPQEVSFVCSPGNPFPQGVTTVTCTATDWSGLTAQCTYDITVTSDLLANAGQDRTLCDGHTAYLGAIATGGNGIYSYEWSNGLGAGNNHTVAVGTSSTTYTVTVTDGNSCTSTDEVNITSSGQVAPTFDNCPVADITANNDAGLCEANVSLPTLTATEGCPLPTLSSTTQGVTLNYYGTYNGHFYYVTSTEVTGADQPAAMAAVHATAQEFSSEGYLATVNDAAENTYLYEMGFHYGSLITGYTDESDENAPFGWFGSCGGCNDGGSTFTNWAGGEPNNVNDEDYTEISISNNGLWNDVDLNEASNHVVVEFNTLPARPINISCSPSNPFPVGTTTVTCTATDDAGYSSTCMYDVVVTDNEAPDPICQNISIDVSAGPVTITTADINNGSTDNCGIQSFSLSEDTFDCNDEGVNTVTLTVLDVNGNSNTCDATVTVQQIGIGFIRN